MPTPLIDSRTRVALSLIMAAGLPLIGVIRWLSNLESASLEHERRIARIEVQAEAQAEMLTKIRETSAATESKVAWLVDYFTQRRDDGTHRK